VSTETAGSAETAGSGLASTSAPTLVLANYQLLTESEQEEVFERIRTLRVEAASQGESDMARFLRSLARVAEVVGRTPTVSEYQAVQPRLRAAGEDIESFTRTYRFFGSWPRAREALELSTSSTPNAVEARLRARRLGKVWRYSYEELRTVLERAVEYWGRPPSVAEFTWWRDRELELARAGGDDDAHLPSSGVYRSRWMTWENALLHHGYTKEEVKSRMDGKRKKPAESDPYLPEGLTVAELADTDPRDLPLTAEETRRLRAAWTALPKRSRYVLTHQLGMGVEPASLRQTAEPIGMHLASIRNIQLRAIDALAGATAGPGEHDMNAYRESVEAVLRALAC
jgi:hypothetical protein